MGVRITKDVMSRVKNMLIQFPHLRDDDLKLIGNVWNQDFKATGRDPATTASIIFLRVFTEGKLTNPESIRRCRQRIQEKNPELRGKTYKARQKKGKQVQLDIHST